MTQLTKAEEEIMHIIWRLGRCIVSDILKEIKRESGKPPHSTISSIVRILESKGFLSHKAYGRTYEYFPIVSKEDYTKKTLNKLVSNYFGGSMSKLVSFLVKEEKIDMDELSEMIEKMKN
ncbi:MAG TPA: BlaI/MecI/CopY family transcriptional regulator [Bacteroidetes bacterium]|nr:BlaI/MecI/CopY family transcriptional regulator [Bacteroidota bacterium]